MGTVSFSIDGPAPHVLPVLQSSRATAVGTTVEVKICLLATPDQMQCLVLPMTVDTAVTLLGQIREAVTAALSVKAT